MTAEARRGKIFLGQGRVECGLVVVHAAGMVAGVLREYQNVRQEPGRRRRWFEGEELELIVWETTAGGIEGFQLCYVARDGAGRALTWRAGEGFVHARVDEGDTSPFKNETPVLRPDGAVPWAELAALFRNAGAALDTPLRELVLARLAARS